MARRYWGITSPSDAIGTGLLSAARHMGELAEEPGALDEFLQFRFPSMSPDARRRLANRVLEANRQGDIVNEGEFAPPISSMVQDPSIPSDARYRYAVTIHVEGEQPPGHPDAGQMTTQHFSDTIVSPTTMSRDELVAYAANTILPDLQSRGSGYPGAGLLNPSVTITVHAVARRP